MDSVFIKVPVSERLPETIDYAVVFEDGTICTETDVYSDGVTHWLEECELPTEEEIIKESGKGWVSSHFQAGANFILDHIKKGGKQ